MSTFIDNRWGFLRRRIIPEQNLAASGLYWPTIVNGNNEDKFYSIGEYG